MIRGPKRRRLAQETGRDKVKPEMVSVVGTCYQVDPPKKQTNKLQNVHLY